MQVDLEEVKSRGLSFGGLPLKLKRISNTLTARVGRNGYVDVYYNPAPRKCRRAWEAVLEGGGSSAVGKGSSAQNALDDLYRKVLANFREAAEILDYELLE